MGGAAVAARRVGDVAFGEGGGEGVAGALAVAAACVYAWRATRDAAWRDANPSLMRFAWEHTPPGATRDGIATALHIGCEATVALAASALGTGVMVTAPDTVPYCVWCSERHLDDYEEALWTTVEGLGDRDTTCAIVGGVVALARGSVIPAEWLGQREALRFEVVRDPDAPVIER